MKLADHDAHSTALVSTLEPVGYQKASTASGTKRKRQSDTDLEDLELLQKKALCLIAINYLNTTDHHRAGKNTMSLRNTCKK